MKPPAPPAGVVPNGMPLRMSAMMAVLRTIPSFISVTPF